MSNNCLQQLLLIFSVKHFINCLHDFVLSHFNNVDDRLKGIKEHLYHHEDFPQKILRTPWPIHFKLRIVIGIDNLTVCILFGEF